MAALLENLASHYDGMASALRETELEKGEVFSEEDMQGSLGVMVYQFILIVRVL